MAAREAELLPIQPLRYLHDCSDCFRLERLPGGIFTHWKSAAFARRTPEPDIRSMSAFGPLARPGHRRPDSDSPAGRKVLVLAIAQPVALNNTEGDET